MELSEGFVGRVRALVRDVGSYQVSVRDGVDTEWKGVDDPVTEADTESERRLRAGLAEILPEASFRGEESGWSSYDGLCWIVDPLDGTKAYVAGRPGYGISVALADGDGLVFGMGYFPGEDTCYWAVSGEGAYRDGERVRVDPALRSVVLSSFFKDVELPYETVVHDGAVYKACKVADGTYGAYPHAVLNGKGVKIWDVAAAAVIVKEAGGTAERLDGSSYSPRDDDPLVDAFFSNGAFDEELRAEFSKQL